MGFNSAQSGDGNITNVVIKSRYALLDLKCNKLEKRLKAFLKPIIKIALDEINEKNNTGYSERDVSIRFEREIMTNALDNAQIEKTDAETDQVRIGTLLNAASLVGEEETARLVCEILDIDYESLESADASKLLEPALSDLE